MAADHQAQVDELLAGYRRSREQLTSVRRSLRALTASESSPDGLVTATVDGRGSLTALVITEQAYRTHRPTELAALIVDASRSAAAAVGRSAAEVLAPIMPAGTDPADVLRGGPDEPERSAPPDDEILEPATWLEGAQP
jgi:DNA-binding protein YbaB